MDKKQSKGRAPQECQTPPSYDASENAGSMEYAPLMGVPTIGDANPHQQPGQRSAHELQLSGKPPQVTSQPWHPTEIHLQPYTQAIYSDTGVVLVQPGGYQQTFVQSPPSHSTLAWMTCIFCCWPLSIVAIAKSSEVGPAMKRGDIVRARKASEAARDFGIWSLYTGLFLYIASVILYFCSWLFGFPKVTYYG